MSTYNENTKLGKIGEQLIHSYLTSRLSSDSKVIFIRGQVNQRNCGDICVIKPEGQKIFIEVKTEASNKHENFFLEEFSNRKTRKPGWMRYCNADILFYVFLKSNEVYAMSLSKLQRWFYETGIFRDYPLKLQRSNEQDNDTYGYVVPIKNLVELGNTIKFSTISTAVLSQEGK